MITSDISLHPRKIAEIEAFLSDIGCEKTERIFRRRLYEQACAEAKREALDRSRFRTALAKARAEGRSDPELYARIDVNTQRIIDRYSARIQSRFKRIERENRRRLNKAATVLERASKSAKVGQRRLPQADKTYLDILGLAENDGWLSDRRLVVSKIKLALKRYRLPHWEKTTTPLKVMAMSVVCAEQGAHTINLHPHPKICEKALASRRGPASYMQDRVKRSLDKEFGTEESPMFWFVIERDTALRFHMHGALATPDLVNAKARLDSALRDAGGGWDSDDGEVFQQKSVPLYGPINWASYVCKNQNVTARDIDRRLVANSRALSALACGEWERIRAELPQS